MYISKLLFFVFHISFTLVYAWSSSCKCTPSDSCWPSTSQWNHLNSSLAGKLIANVPPAICCYAGPDLNNEECATVKVALTKQDFISENPIALSYPTESCPPINATNGSPCTIGYQPSDSCPDDNTTSLLSSSCSIGDQPRYSINATDIADVKAGVDFARTHNIRLVIRNTGHDILRRSTGYGSLQIWIKYLRKGIAFQNNYKSSSSCRTNTWSGSAFKIAGGYTWEDVYPEAAARNVVVVGGGTPSVGCLGGWMQGGGHSPATHDYGLGADQVLEAQVVLASGQVIIASACENQDVFFAIRGGGPSTYGVVVSTTIKAHPVTKVAAQVLSFAPLTPHDMPTFMEAVALMYQAYPDLSDDGFSGYGSWSIYSPTPIVANYSTSFIHTIAVFGKTATQAELLFNSTMAKLIRYNGTSLYLTVSYVSFPTYHDYYDTFSGVKSPVGTTAALGSRLLDRQALTGNPSALKRTLSIIAGTPEQATSNNIVFVGGGQVFKDANDPFSGVNPAWRKAYVHNIIARGWASGSSKAAIQSVYDDITHNKTQAMKDLAPDSGCYMNEADRFDPNFLKDYYGQHARSLEGIKKRRDPGGVFYCPTCIGSEEWNVQEAGGICRAHRWGHPEQGNNIHCLQQTCLVLAALLVLATARILLQSTNEISFSNPHDQFFLAAITLLTAAFIVVPTADLLASMAPTTPTHVGIASTFTPTRFIATVWTLVAVAISIFAGRIITRIVKRKRGITDKHYGLKYDDAFMALAVFFFILNAILQTLQMDDLYFLQQTSTDPHDVKPGSETMVRGDRYLKYQFAIIGIFWSVLWSVKCSFLALYKMLFRGTQGGYMRWLWVVASITGIGYGVCWATSASNCHPAANYFHFGKCQSVKEHNGSEISVGVTTGVDVFTDIIIMLLPMHMVWTFCAHKRDKVALLVLFSLTMAVMAISIARGASIARKTFDDGVLLALWGLAENTVAVVVGSLPAYKAWLRKPRRSSTPIAMGNLRRTIK